MALALDPARGHLTRRGFLMGAAGGLATGGALAWLGRHTFPNWGAGNPGLAAYTGRSVEVPKPEYALPGPFPGRVIEVHHPGSVRADTSINHQAVRAMIDRGMRELTGADHLTEAWRRFFEPGDVVGIKVNPVGQRYRPHQPQAISSPEVVLEVVAGLRSAGVKPRDIILFERYARQFESAGYETLLRERALDGVRWYASAVDYDDRQVDLEGYDFPADRNPHIVGYDPDVFVHLAYASPQHDPRDDRRFRSHLSVVVSRFVNKIISIPVLKDHGSAGVTLALKNLSHGLHNNVARSHLAKVPRDSGRVSGPNQCNTFIPTVVAQPLVRQKVVLHILDGLIGVYEGGPSPGHTWINRSLFFGTDPVALDQVGWGIVDAERGRHGMPPVGRMGLYGSTARERAAEPFDRRQPEHILLAGMIGLGKAAPDEIDHRRLTLRG